MFYWAEKHFKELLGIRLVEHGKYQLEYIICIHSAHSHIIHKTYREMQKIHFL